MNQMQVTSIEDRDESFPRLWDERLERQLERYETRIIPTPVG